MSDDLRLSRRASGQWRADYVPGWRGFTMQGQAEVIEGVPAVTELVITRNAGEPSEALTASRLRTLPLREIATWAVTSGVIEIDLDEGMKFSDESRAAYDKIASREPSKHDSRASTTVEQVAEVWNHAYRAGLAPRAKVCEVLKITERTADRYIKRARDMQLITATRRGSRLGPKTPDVTAPGSPENGERDNA